MDRLTFRFATENDVKLYFSWANDENVRENSYDQAKLSYHDHETWFASKLKSENCKLYLFSTKLNDAVGQVRIDKVDDEVVIGISIDKNHRGFKYAKEMLVKSTNHYLQAHPGAVICAYIKTENRRSYKSFVNAGFKEVGVVDHHNVSSYKLICFNVFT